MIAMLICCGLVGWAATLAVLVNLWELWRLPAVSSITTSSGAFTMRRVSPVRRIAPGYWLVRNLPGEPEHEMTAEPFDGGLVFISGAADSDLNGVYRVRR